MELTKNSTTVVTANGDVQTNEEAQVYVHDLDLFVKVQLLEDTPAVLSLGKLCEQNGYSYEWQNCQKPLLTKIGKFFCKTENVVPLVVPGLSSISGASSSSTSPPQDSSSTCSSPATQRSDKQATADRLRDLPEWLKEFTENLEDAETLVPAHVGRAPPRVSSFVFSLRRYVHLQPNMTCDMDVWLKV